MQAVTETQLTTDADAQIASAEAQLEKLRSAAADADAEVTRWTIAADREPTEQAVVQQLVAERKAKRAHAEAEAFERDTLGPLRDEQRQARRERDEATMRSIVDRIGEARDITTAGLVRVAGSLDDLIMTLCEFAARQQQSSVAFSIEHAQIARICERIGRDANAAIDNGRVAVEFLDTGNTGELVVKLTLAGDVPHTLR